MSLQPETIATIPEETARIARAIFPKGNRYLLLRDDLGTIMQYMENYTDRQAAEAVKVRIDWKYALSLEMTDQGFDFSVPIASFEPGWCKRSRKRCFSIPCSRCAESVDGSKNEADSVPTRPMSRPLSVPSTGWNALERRCVLRSTVSRVLFPNGYRLGSPLNGTSAMISASRIFASRRKQPNVKPFSSK